MREPIAVPFSPRNDHTVSVTLDEAVLRETAAFAKRIEMANRKNKRRNKQGLKVTGAESLAFRIRGLSGEAALAQYLGLPPVRMADEWRHKPDVLCFDCLTTDKAHGALIITPRDRLDMMKVLVIDRSPVFHICGWYRASDARLEAERRHSEWWRTERADGGAWYVPQSYLRSLADAEAQKELARHYRQWTGTQYIDFAPIYKREPGAYVMRNGGRIEWLPDDGKEKLRGMEISYVEIDQINRQPTERFDPGPIRLDEMLPVAGQGYVSDALVHDADTTDWREVLRRAGAEPPSEKEWKANMLGSFDPPPTEPDPKATDDITPQNDGSTHAE